MPDFKKIMQSLKSYNRGAIHGVEWAEVYVADDGTAVARYKTGKHIKLTSRPDYFLEFNTGFDRYQVDMRAINLKDGAVIEAKKAESLLHGNAKKKPFNY